MTLLGLMAPGVVTAAAGEGEAWHGVLLLDNDSNFQPFGYLDSHYSFGGRVAVARSGELADRIARWLPATIAFPNGRTAVGLYLAQSIYTPQRITSTLFFPGDRAWAGYMGFGAFVQRSTLFTHDNVEFELGMIGPATPMDDLQTFLHRATDSEIPRGWQFQLRNEFTVQANWRRSWRIRLAGPARRVSGSAGTPARGMPFGLELIPDVALAVGTFRRNAEVAIAVRFGFGLPDDLPGARADRMPDLTGAAGPTPSFAVFVRGLVRFVEHDITLNGNTWAESHQVIPEPVVFELQFGFSVRTRTAARTTFAIDYAVTFRSDEFKGDRLDEIFGSIALRFSWH